MSLLIQPPQWQDFDVNWRKSHPDPTFSGWGNINPGGSPDPNSVYKGITFSQWQGLWDNYRSQEQADFKKQFGFDPVFDVAGPPMTPTTKNESAPPSGQIPLLPPATTTTPAMTTPIALTPPTTTATTTTPDVTTTPLAPPQGTSLLQSPAEYLKKLFSGINPGVDLSLKLPDPIKQTQQKWGGFSPSLFTYAK